MALSATSSMKIDILKYKDSEDIMTECKALGDIECFRKYAEDPEEGIPLRELIVYVVLLYSKDSFLNKKPMERLQERRLKAANIAGLSYDSVIINKQIFDLESDKFRELALDYLIHQDLVLWTERNIVEAQMVENQRIRFKPIQIEDDKSIIEASVKKKTLTQDFSIYHELMKKYDAEIFQDHENLKSMVKKTRTTVESMAQ